MKFIKFTALTVLLLLASIPAIAQKLKPEEIIAKHLDSIGTTDARAGAKSRMIIGDVIVTFVTQKNQSAEGRVVMASEGNKHLLGMNLNGTDYQQEKFTFNGKRSVTATANLSRRSSLGAYVDSNNVMLENGLLGGVLSTAWVPLNSSGGKSKFGGGGSKKISGRDTYVIDYSPKGGDVDITLYFEKESFRHIRTEYKHVLSAAIGTSPDQSSRFNETRYKLTEDFSDFKNENGLTMPHIYKIIYEASGHNGTIEISWAMNLTTFTYNPNLDANTFEQ